MSEREELEQEEVAVALSRLRFNFGTWEYCAIELAALGYVSRKGVAYTVGGLRSLAKRPGKGQ